MQTWANEPYRATRKPLEKVDGSVPKVWWLRELPRSRESSFQSEENLSIEFPFLTRYYFQSHLFLTLEACIFDFVRDYRDESTGEPSEFENRKRDSVEMETWADHLTGLGLTTDEFSSVVRGKILSAIKLLRHKTIHREILEDDELWFSMKLPEFLVDWHRTFEIQQVFMFVRDSSAMETEVRKEMDQLLFGPKTPPKTLLEAHTWLQYSLEELCFRFTQRNYPEMLKDRKWEWSEQCELQRSWESALAHVPAGKDSLDPEEDSDEDPDKDSDKDPEDWWYCPDDESKLFSQNRLRADILLQGRNLRDAASHRGDLSETFLRKHALNGILLAIMLRDREQAIDIEATIEAFLTGKTKYQVLTRLRAACAHDRPIPMDQLGERRKREAVATYLGDNEVYVSEASNGVNLRSAGEDSNNGSLKDYSQLAAESNSRLAEHRDSSSSDDNNRGRPFLETAVWGYAIEKFVIGDSMHEVFGSRDELLINQARADQIAEPEEEWCWE